MRIVWLLRVSFGAEREAQFYIEILNEILRISEVKFYV
jgi:hypothetical protein